MIRARDVLVLLFAIIALCSAACASVFGFADQFAEADGGPDAGFAEGEGALPPPTYSIGGHVTGVAGTSMTLLNVKDSLLLTQDGPFQFKARLLTGGLYDVVVDTPPPNKTCGVVSGAGTVANADVTNVAVSCISTDATLSNLTLSAASLTPGFSPGTVAYTATANLALIGPTTTTVTATTAVANATLTIDGKPATSGVASAPIALPAGQTAITVAVKAASGATATYTINVTAAFRETYVKASNTGTGNGAFGQSVALSSDGTTMAVGAIGDPSSATGINGVQTGTGAPLSGAVYVFTRAASGTWSQQAYIKASNTRMAAGFGSSVALSFDGNTLAVGSPYESSAANTINGNQSDATAMGAGAVYVFTRTAMTTWTQQAYVKASNALANAQFGGAVALSATGDTLAVGAIGESSNATGIGGNQSDTSFSNAGAAYVYTRSVGAWTQQAYVKASNTRAGAFFGTSVSLASADGSTLVVGAPRDASNAVGIDGNGADTSAMFAGAAYVYTRSGALWSQQAYVKASNTRLDSFFGASVTLASDGNTLAVGATNESSNATGINGNQSDTSATNAGAAYVFTRAGMAWSQQAYVKAGNTRASAFFGTALSMSGDGSVLAVSADNESSAATGVGGNQADTSAPGAGATYLYTSNGAMWSPALYVKASNTRATASFGIALALSSDAKTLAVGATHDTSNATGIGGNQADTSAANAGAAYVLP